MRHRLTDEQGNEMSEILRDVSIPPPHSQFYNFLAHHLFKTFCARLVEVIDQAQHFAALGPAGAGGSSGDAAQAFREGLDTTERECESRPA